MLSNIPTMLFNTGPLSCMETYRHLGIPTPNPWKVGWERCDLPALWQEWKAENTGSPPQSPTGCLDSCWLLKSDGHWWLFVPLVPCICSPHPLSLRHDARATDWGAGPRVFPRLVASSSQILVSVSRGQIDHSALSAQLPLEEEGWRALARTCRGSSCLVTANDISPSAGSSIS